MKHFLSTVKKKRTLLLFSAAILFAAGVYLTSTNAFKLAKAYFFYEKQKADYHVIKTAPAKASETEGAKPSPLYETRPVKGEKMGELIIPKLEAVLPIYHGTDEDELEKGVGHFAQSVLPGEKDNSVLSGHRDTVFRQLGKVGENDLLIVKTSAGTFTYKIRKVRIVDENDRTVIVPKPRATLTVSTCYPFDFIGSAPERYVLIANLIKTEKP
ncbi:class D sortase [Bacillus sp. SJS]|uniref:class D sortase n=1 Tax=Bacillus sp. SJS TaxID=1423321 RepID=UPI0009EF258D|nr:class D sortase [Bacillus sp. SJS]